MARFHYSLQPALDHALARERDALAAAVAAQSALSGARRAMAALDMDICAVRRSVYAALATSPTVAAGAAGTAHAAALVKKSVVCRSQVAAAQLGADAARTAHALVRRRKTALERQRERRYSAFLATCELRAAAELDESNALQRRQP